MATIESEPAQGAPVRVRVLNLPEPQWHQRSNPNLPPIITKPERLGGTPTIGDSRLPVVALIDNLLAGHTIEEFAAQYDAELGDVEAVLLRIREALEEGWLAEQV